MGRTGSCLVAPPDFGYELPMHEAADTLFTDTSRPAQSLPVWMASPGADLGMSRVPWNLGGGPVMLRQLPPYLRARV